MGALVEGFRSRVVVAIASLKITTMGEVIAVRKRSGWGCGGWQWLKVISQHLTQRRAGGLSPSYEEREKKKEECV